MTKKEREQLEKHIRAGKLTQTEREKYILFKGKTFDETLKYITNYKSSDKLTKEDYLKAEAVFYV